MSLRDKFFKAMRRKNDNYIPFEFVLCPSKIEEFRRRTGREDYEEYFSFPVRTIFTEYKGSIEQFKKYHTGEDNITIDRWGVGHKKGSTAHFSLMIPPMSKFESLEQFMEYPYTDPEDYDWEQFAQKVEELQQRDLVVASADIEETVFETAWYLRGMENFLVDMAINPELAHYHMDRIIEVNCEFARRIAAAGCDILRLGDDVSTQLDMMISVEQWREFIKPRLFRVIQEAKRIKPDILIFYHGDGNLGRIIPELIEIGVEILNPVQPECLDPVKLKSEYGDSLSFWGTIGTQSTMPFGTPQEVKRICRKMIETVGKGGGLLLAPTHVLEPEVPWENIQAFIDTVQEYNNRAD